MGILDKKTRFIDLVVTQEGKRQIAAGKLRAEFASLSDCHAFYSKGDREDVAQRLYFEVMERPENAIVLEKDDSGKLISFNFSSTGSIVGNNIFLKDTTRAQRLSLSAATGSRFEVGQNSIFRSSLEHFKKNYFIGQDDILENDEFELNIDKIEFTIDNKLPFGNSPNREIINVNNADPFFTDSKLTHLENFQFLPPKNTDGSNYGNYKDIRSTSRETWDDIKNRVGAASYNKIDDTHLTKDNNIKGLTAGQGKAQSRKLLVDGKIPLPVELTKEDFDIRFVKTSTENNLLIQMFEDSTGATINKLDIVDAGIFEDFSDRNRRFEKRVFYVGKIFEDDFNTPTFVNIFTIIMD